MKNLIIFAVISTFAFNISAQRGIGNVKIQNENGKIQEVKLYEASYALVIGASNYHSGWLRLPQVKEDVTAVSKVLTKHGFSVETAIDPTSKNLTTIISDFITRYGFSENNRLLIYFAGHGYTETGGDGRKFGYIVPVDAPDPNKNLTEFQQKAVSMHEIESAARRIRSKHALFVFDSCFSGSLISGSKSVIPPHITYWTTQPVRLFITSGSEDEEVPATSIFREMFIRGLEGEANNNNDEYITGTELAVYLQEKVIYYSDEKQTPQYGKIRDPKLDRGDFVFTLSAPSEPNNLTASNRTKAASLANQALAAIMRADYTEAESLADQAIKLDNSSALGYGIRGWAIGFNKNDSNLAINDLEKAIRLDSNNPLLYAFLAYLHYIFQEDRNSLEKAKGFANTALQKLVNPLDPAEHYAKGLSLTSLIKFEQAIDAYSEAIKQNPQFVIIYLHRGNLYQLLNKNDLAIRDYTEAVKFNSSLDSVYYRRGILYHEKKEYDLAIVDFNNFIKFNPSDDFAYYIRGLSYLSKENFNLAIRDFTKSIGLNPTKKFSYFNRAIAYDKIGQKEKAEADRRKYRELGGQ